MTRTDRRRNEFIRVIVRVRQSQSGPTEMVWTCTEKVRRWIYGLKDELAGGRPGGGAKRSFMDVMTEKVSWCERRTTQNKKK